MSANTQLGMILGGGGVSAWPATRGGGGPINKHERKK